MKVRIKDNKSNDEENYNFNYRTRRKLSKAIAKKMKNGVDFVEIKDGDKVKLNYERITGRNDYLKEDTVNEKYKEFVESNKNTIFTVKSEKITTDKNSNKIMKLFTLEESEIKWLFHPVDLIKVDDIEVVNSD